MEENLEKGLVERFPDILRDHRGDPKQTCMAWGLCIGDGWYLLLNDLLVKLDDLTKGTKYQVVAHQIKEKFGGLRFYYGIEYDPNVFQRMFSKISTFAYKKKLGRQYNKISDFRKKIYKTKLEKIYDAVSEAECKSYETCERCGNPGKTRGGGWVVTLCDQCHEEKNNK